MTDTATIIATISKNSREQVIVSIDNFHGADLVDIRVNALFDDSEDFRPTKKGAAVKVEKLPEFISALEGACAEAQRRGLLDGDSP
jgi:hypothetical protein